MTDQSTVVWLWTSMSSWLSLSPTTLFLFLNLVIGTIAVSSRFTSNKKPQHQLGSYHSPEHLARAPSLLDRVKSINFPLYKFHSDEHDEQQIEQEQQHEQEQEQEQHYFHQPTHPLEPEHSPQLARAPSLLDRVKSINFSLYKFPNLSQEERGPEPNRFHQPYDTNLAEPEQLRLARAPSLLERVKSIKLPSIYRSQETESEVNDNEETETNPLQKPTRSKSKKSKPKVKQNMKKSMSEKSMQVEETEMVERRRPQTARLDRTDSVGDGDDGVDAKADDFINKFKRQLRLQRLDSLLRYKEILQGK